MQTYTAKLKKDTKCYQMARKSYYTGTTNLDIKENKFPNML